MARDCRGQVARSRESGSTRVASSFTYLKRQARLGADRSPFASGRGSTQRRLRWRNYTSAGSHLAPFSTSRRLARVGVVTLQLRSEDPKRSAALSMSRVATKARGFKESPRLCRPVRTPGGWLRRLPLLLGGSRRRPVATRWRCSNPGAVRATTHGPEFRVLLGLTHREVHEDPPQCFDPSS